LPILSIAPFTFFSKTHISVASRFSYLLLKLHYHNKVFFFFFSLLLFFLQRQGREEFSRTGCGVRNVYCVLYSFCYFVGPSFSFRFFTSSTNLCACYARTNPRFHNCHLSHTLSQPYTPTTLLTITQLFKTAKQRGLAGQMGNTGREI
jgi:hypothetical protein